jgi:hypothetical protein
LAVAASTDQHRTCAAAAAAAAAAAQSHSLIRIAPGIAQAFRSRWDLVERLVTIEGGVCCD